MRLWAMICVALFVTLPGCGGGAPEIPPELIDDGGAGDSADDGSYPSGPYGAQEGDTLENLTFSGYRDPSESQQLEEISFADFHDPDGEKGHQLLLFNTAAAWCQPCRIEHADLPERAARHEDEGLVVFSMLFQDPDGDPPTEETLSTWTTGFDTNFPMALDPSYQMGRYGPAETPPLNLVVDPRDMTLLARFVGNQEGPMWAFIEDELERRNQ